MKSAVETLESTRVKLTVEVTFEELAPVIDHALEHIGQQIQVPGFRKGKVPGRIVEQRVGRAAVLEHAINDGMPDFYRQAIEQNELRPLGQPDIEITKVPETTEADDTLEFTAEVDIRPELSLPDWADITVKVDDVEVSDESVQKRLDTLRERFGSLVGVDRPAEDGDFVVIDLKGEAEGEEIDNVSGVSYQIGSENMLEGLDEALIGLSAGETTTFEAPLAGGPQAGKVAQITVTAQSVKERDLPEADDDFAQMASEFDTLDELVADLRTEVGRDKGNEQAVQARDRLLEEIMSQIEVPVPARLIEDEIHRHLESEGRLDDDEHRAEVEESTTKAFERQILLDIVAEKLKVEVTQQELLEFMVNAAGRMGTDPNEFIQTLDQQGQVPAVVGEVARNKALSRALRYVAVVDESGEPVDLSEFIGSDEEDAKSQAEAEAAAAGAGAEALEGEETQ
ncbi:MAG TPA: trigger factor [Actinomycetales bacterium]|nr:trigger factor [Actinomycetales bacterium]